MAGEEGDVTPVLRGSDNDERGKPRQPRVALGEGEVDSVVTAVV